MRTHPDCYPCFLRQAVKTARIISPDNERLQLDIVSAWSETLSTLDPSKPPPQLAGPLYALAAEIAGVADPFRTIKDEANRLAQSLLPELSELVESSSDPLRTALGLSIFGNAMDAGTPHAFDVQSALARQRPELFDDAQYAAFVQELDDRPSVLILGDNCGEIVFDTLLVRELTSRGAAVAYVVRGRPVLNDACLEDARAVGMTELCEVIDSGVDTPGTVPQRCSSSFLARMREADVILSKGQGNFEALYGRLPGVYFALMVKCPVVACELGEPEGRSVFRRG